MNSPVNCTMSTANALIKRSILATVFFLCSSIASTQLACGQSALTVKTTAELTQVVLKQAEAWNRGDLAGFMVPYWKDERLTFSSGGKTKRGWQATLDNYRMNYPNREAMGKLTFSNLETQELGADAMLMLGAWNLERAEPIGGNFTLVWKRIVGKWFIVHDHSSALKP